MVSIADEGGALGKFATFLRTKSLICKYLKKWFLGMLYFTLYEYFSGESVIGNHNRALNVEDLYEALSIINHDGVVQYIQINPVQSRGHFHCSVVQ